MDRTERCIWSWSPFVTRDMGILSRRLHDDIREKVWEKPEEKKTKNGWDFQDDLQINNMNGWITTESDRKEQTRHIEIEEIFFEWSHHSTSS